ncbi:hypothetical protein GCM10010381_18390 [Streptomyces xantholiticus]|nr:hypothetical protein GCM10010381_18390 [Streptomyces xantholiticus]
MIPLCVPMRKAWSPGPGSVARSPGRPSRRAADAVRAYGAEWLEAIGGAERLRRLPATGTWNSPPGASSKVRPAPGRGGSTLTGLRAPLELCQCDLRQAHLGRHPAGALSLHRVACAADLAEGRPAGWNGARPGRTGRSRELDRWGRGVCDPQKRQPAGSPTGNGGQAAG